MASGDNRVQNESDFNRILEIVRSRSMLQTALGATRPSCFTSGADGDGGAEFDFCNESFFQGPRLVYDYSTYTPERSNLAEVPDETRLLALFRKVVPVLVYLGTSATRRLSGYVAPVNGKYGQISPSLRVRASVSTSGSLGEFTQNAYFSYWFSLHPNVRRQILDVIVSLSPTLGADNNCVRSPFSDPCTSDRARALLRTVSALRQTVDNVSLDSIIKQLRPDVNTSRPSRLLARSRSRGVAR